jgi:ferredoxin/flavodoxin
MNEIEIYYFSGTGNSLYVARDVSDKTNGKIINIASMMEKKVIISNADTIGIVFPVHYIWNGGVPLFIINFIKKLKDINTKYIFGICVYGIFYGDTIKTLRKIVKIQGGSLAAGFSVKMPYNYISWSDSLLSISIEKQQYLFSKWNMKLDVISEYVINKRKGRFETAADIMLSLTDMFDLRVKIGKPHYQVKAGFLKTDLPFEEILPLMDKSFKYDDKCNGCGICSRICPVGNIKLSNNKPLWQHHCEQCFACFQWCPKEAIQFGNKTVNGKRYRHPSVKLTDMITYEI